MSTVGWEWALRRAMNTNAGNGHLAVDRQREASVADRTDEELLIAAGQGDRRAFGQLVERHDRGVLAFIHRFLGTGDRDQAEDVAQDVFLKAWKGAKGYRPRAKCSTWLLQIARNTCLNHQRSGRLRRTLPLDEHAALHQRNNDDGVGGDDAGELTRDVREAIADLPEKQRAAIILRHYHELSYTDVAATLGLTVSAVETLLFRARKALRTRLIQEGAARKASGAPQGSAESCV